MNRARSLTAVARWAGALFFVLGALACSKSAMPDTHGGETHFLSHCESECGDGLACVCGVCTSACDGAAACQAFADGAVCVASDSLGSCNGGGGSEQVCDYACAADGDCGALGSGYRCQTGACRWTGASLFGDGDGAAPDTGDGDQGIAVDGDVPGPGDGDTTSAGDGDGDDEPNVPPLVFLLLDTSGSMERQLGCECTTPSCDECLPDCAAGERTRWMLVTEALSGSMSGYSCQALERSEDNGATYDLGYYLPHHVAEGTLQDDGLLSVYADRLRFGAATFDGWDSWLGQGPMVPAGEFDREQSDGEPGLWSYPPASVLARVPERSDGIDPGLYRYPNCIEDYRMDTGIRSMHADDGALRVPSTAADVQAVRTAIAAMLPDVRPYGGTPIAAALDDLYYLFAHDPLLSEERAHPGREQHVVLITDGVPDDDYRMFGCDCQQNDDPEAPGYCGGGRDNAAGNMRCPYPLAWRAAERLRCGDDGDCERGPVTAVHVIAIGTDPDATAVHDTIAAAGGTGLARKVADASGLRAALAELLDQLASR